MSISGPALQSVIQQMQATAAQAGQGAKAPTAPVSAKGMGPTEGTGLIESTGATGQTDSFAAALMHSIDKIDALKQSAAATGHAYERGEPGIGINDVMVGMEKAGLAVEMGIQVRNRVVTAYKDIMNMQV